MSAKIEIEGLEGTFSLFQIAGMSKHHLSREVVYERWKRSGSKNPIDTTTLAMILEPRNANGTGARIPRYKYEGKMVTVRELAKILNTSVTTVRKIVREKGSVLTAKDINISRMHQKGQNETKKITVADAKKEESNVGWAERLYFPETGKNGFTGGKSEFAMPMRLIF